MSKEKLFGNEFKYPFKFGGFTIYKTHGICDTCGKKIEGGGIIVWSNHYVQCAGKGFYEGMMKMAAEKKEAGQSITVPDLEKLISKEIK